MKISVSEMIDALGELSLKEMGVLRDELDSAMEARRPIEKEKFKSQVENMAKELGLRLDEIFEDPRSPSALPKFINPANPEQTWAGIGKRPHWLRQKLENGHKVSDFLSENLTDDDRLKIEAALAKQ